MSRSNEYKELLDKFQQHCIENNKTIIILQYPFKHSYQTTKDLIIDSIPKFKP